MTDGEIVRAVREGIGRDGSGLFPMMPYSEYRHLAGGHVHRGPWGTVVAPNLTPHPTGMGGRTEEAFVGMFRAFAAGESRAIPARPGENTPMPWLNHAGLTDQDLTAIWAYLQTVPPVENRVERRPQVAAAAAGPVGAGR